MCPPWLYILIILANLHGETCKHPNVVFLSYTYTRFSFLHLKFKLVYSWEWSYSGAWHPQKNTKNWQMTHLLNVFFLSLKKYYTVESHFFVTVFFVIPVFSSLFPGTVLNFSYLHHAFLSSFIRHPTYSSLFLISIEVTKKPDSTYNNNSITTPPIHTAIIWFVLDNWD